MKGAFTTCVDYYRRAGAVAWQTLIGFRLLLLIAFLVAPAVQVHAADLFAGGKATISDTFGSGSTVVWVLYILEIIAAIFAYVKTKNLAMFGGIAAVMVFVNVAFGIIPS